MKIRPAVQEDVREMMEIFNYEARNSTASFAITEQSYEERLAWFRSHGGERHPLIAAEQDGRVAATPACQTTALTRLTRGLRSFPSMFHGISEDGESGKR